MTKQSLKRRMRLYMIVVSLIMVIFAFAGVGCRKAKPTLTSVEVQTAPTKTEYIVGDTLSA